jgi:molybdopterin converting factor subunit 1|uniref:Molybdopterin synthase sulfur carrier subunit n=1 Tax=Globisporangium ultimum (strain ATCC 200006 / CBS 805.95 / DAOM BR144) TaxID=431595 RepID=K3XC56_GLOUD
MGDVIRVNVLYFASVREEIGKREEEVTLSTSGDGGPVTLGTLRKLLCEMYPEADAVIRTITLARNLEYSTDDIELHQGDEVALIPPISGG